MRFTDIFVRRPVLASVVSLLILLGGLQAFYKLQIRQFPELSSTTITRLGDNVSVGAGSVVSLSNIGDGSTIGARAYVANSFSNNVTVIDTTTNTVVGGPITVGTSPISVGIGP